MKRALMEMRGGAPIPVLKIGAILVKYAPTTVPPIPAEQKPEANTICAQRETVDEQFRGTFGIPAQSKGDAAVDSSIGGSAVPFRVFRLLNVGMWQFCGKCMFCTAVPLVTSHPCL